MNTAAADLLELSRQWLDTLFAPWVRELALEPVRIDPGVAELRLPFSERICREGGTLCGQSLMAAADTAMVIALCSLEGRFRPMTTVSLTSSFMRAVSSGDSRLIARVLKPGRTLSFGEIVIEGPDGKLAAQITTTYAML